MSFKHSEAFKVQLAKVEANGCPHCGATGNWLVDDDEAPYCFHCSKAIYPDGSVAPTDGNKMNQRDRGCRLAESCLKCPFNVCKEEEPVNV